MGEPERVRLVILSRPDPVQIYTTNRVASLVPVAAVLSETGRPFGRRHSRRLRSLVRRRGPLAALDRYLDLAYFRLRRRLDRHDETIGRILGEDGDPRSYDPALDVREVESVNDASSVELLRRLAPDIIFCNGASILKRPVIEVARLAVINLHTGIVPEYRGPSPEFWALYNEDFDRVGVTVHHLTEEVDGGDVILQERTPVRPGDDELALRCRNVRAGARLVAEAVGLLASGAAPRRPQDPARARSWPRRTRREHRRLRRLLRTWRRDGLPPARSTGEPGSPAAAGTGPPLTRSGAGGGGAP